MEKGARVASIILGGSGVVCLIALAYLLYHYSWTDFASMLMYYSVPAFLAGFCFASLWLLPSHRINVALLVLSTGASLYAGEILMTIWFSLPSVRAEMALRSRAEVAEEFGVDFDHRSPLDVADDLRKAGIDAYPISRPRLLLERQADGRLTSKLSPGTELLPLGGISNKVSILCNESAGYVLYESDEYGFHNPKGLWKTGQVDILAVGDSYAHGFCVPSDRNFVAVIRQRHPATLNLGLAGSGPLVMLATLKEYGPIVRPKVVLWFHYQGNDLRDLARESASPLLMRYLEENFRQGLSDRQADIDRALTTHMERLRNTSRLSRRLTEIVEVFGDPRVLLGKTVEIIKLTTLRQQLGLLLERRGNSTARGNQASPQDMAVMRVFRETLLHAKDFVSTWEGQLYFIYLPHWHRYAYPDSAARSREPVLQTARALGLRVIDIHHVFKAQEDPLDLFPFRQHNHYNERGHRLVAEEVLRAVVIR